MRIRVKLFANLQDLLPPGTGTAGTELEVQEDVTPNQIIDRLRVPRRSAHLVLRNGVYLGPEERDRAVFREGDVLAIWPPVAGG